MKDFKFSLGSIVKDRITGFKGVIICRSQWLTNCNTYGVKPQELDKDNKPHDAQYFDEPNLILVKADIFAEPEIKTGGPTERIRETNR
jgi:heat shock protein HspQ